MVSSWEIEGGYVKKSLHKLDVKNRTYTLEVRAFLRSWTDKLDLLKVLYKPYRIIHHIYKYEN